MDSTARALGLVPALNTGCGIHSSSFQQSITPLGMCPAVREARVLKQMGLGWKMCLECWDGVTQDSVEQEVGRGVGRGQSRALSTLLSGQTHCFIGTYSADSHHQALSLWGEKKQFWDCSPLSTEYPCMERIL